MALLEPLESALESVDAPWRRLDLERAVFDIKVVLRILGPSARIEISNHNWTIIKTNDLIYSIKYPSRTDKTVSTVRGVLEEGETWVPIDGVVIHKVGRRCRDRRTSDLGVGAPSASQLERRGIERRVADRRRFNRLTLINRMTSDRGITGESP